MKKILLIITISLTIVLAGCVPTNNVDTLTESEIEQIVADYLDGIENTNEVTTTYDLQSYEAAIVDMLDEVKTSVVGIIAISDYTGGTGSGVIYKKEGTTTYYLVTNDHVVNHTDPLTGTSYLANNVSIVYEKNGLLFEITNEYVEIIGTDPTTDLAVLRFESSEEFNVIEFADSYELEVGQFVYAIGNPLGFEYYGTVTSGIVSGLARYVVDGDFNATLLQHDAAISPGNSGGALVNTNGELIGINNMKIVLDDVSGIGFAIPSNTVKRIVEDLEVDGIVTRPYLGISTYAQINACGLDFGVCIDVQEGGAADNAGLVSGDVIVGYKNEDADEFLGINNFNDLKEAILNSSVGETIVMEYYHNNGTLEDPDWVLTESIPTVLGVHPDDE
jgi:serine protease Do